MIQWEEKIWGKVAHLFDESVSVSLLHVTTGFRCSIHYHQHRCNSFKVVEGCIDVVMFAMDGEVPVEISRVKLTPGDSFDVLPNFIHRFEVLASGKVVEVYWTLDGSPVDLNDIVRLDEGGKL